MTKDYSPFTPGQPVPVEFFVGREAELRRVAERAAAAEKRLQVAFLCGERGIGKSSLASFARRLAEQKHSALGLHVLLGGVVTLEEMVRRVFDSLLEESLDKPWMAKVRDFFGQRIKEVGLFGISLKFDAPEGDLRRMAHDFAPALRNLMRRLRGTKKSIFLILDDINGLAREPSFANWIKSLVDGIATSDEPLPLFLMLVGLEERRQSLISLQPSLARVFDVIDISPWTTDETRRFYETAFATVSVTVEEKALDELVGFAGGLPVLAHEIGDAVFKVDTDNHIDQRDAMVGVVGAADTVGRKLLEPQVFKAIRSERYRAILRKIARKPFRVTFRRRELIGRLTDNERKVLDNFLKRMKRLGVICSEPECGPGAYRFTNQLHYLYFCLEAERAREARDH